MRLLYLLQFLCLGIGAAFGQSVEWAPLQFNVEDSADQWSISTSPLKVWHSYDSIVTVEIKELTSDRSSLDWERTLSTSTISYPPFFDSVFLDVSPGDTSWLVFDYIPQEHSGCVYEEYSICDTGSGRCDTIRITVCALSTARVSEIPEIHFYPNPASDRVHLSIPSNIEMAVCDQWGREAIPFEATKSLNISKLPPGGYFLIIRSEEGTWRHQRMLIKR